MWIDDQILSQHSKPMVAKIWIPDRNYVVIGCSNKLEEEVYAERCRELGHTLLQRYGGGGAVVLYPGCVVISVGAWVAKPFENHRYFTAINRSLISVLEQGFSVEGLEQNGISDITLGERKIAGTSMFRSKNYLLYQASLLCELDIELIAGALKHPTKEPEYRGARSHADFLTGLGILPEKVALVMERKLHDSLEVYLGSDLIVPQESQFKNLLRRVERGEKGEGQLS